MVPSGYVPPYVSSWFGQSTNHQSYRLILSSSGPPTGLFISLAHIARQIGVDLCANTNTVAHFHRLHFGPYFHSLAHDLVTDAKRHWSFAPAASDLVHIAAADATAFDCHVDVVVFEWLELELQEM